MAVTTLRDSKTSFLPAVKIQCGGRVHLAGPLAGKEAGGFKPPPPEIFRVKSNSATKVEICLPGNGQLSMEATVFKYCRS